MIKAVIFDMGGVLLRTYDSGPREVLGQQYGFSMKEMFHIIFASESSQQAERGDKTDLEHWSWALDQLGVAAEDREDFIKKWWSGDRMDYELLEFINGLRPALRTGVLSNAWLGTRTNIDKHWGGLDKYFDVVVYSAEVGLRKPDPQIFSLLLNKLDAKPEETIFVDDFSENINAAQALGMQTVQFCSPDQAKEELLAKLNHTPQD